MFNSWKPSLLAAVATLVFAGAAQAADPVKISGTGATFPAPLYAKWVEAYNKGHAASQLGYSGTGSGAGIKAVTDRTAEFAGSDAPMTQAQEKAAPAPILHIPTVAGPAVMIYNVPGVAKLTLDGNTISGIFLNKIKNWNDPKIAALNAGAILPDMPIVVVHRSDGSGTSFIFTDYLSKVSADWKSKVGKGTTVQWPVGLGGQGNAGVASQVKSTEGGIGYVEWAYATAQKLPFADVVNKDGKAVTASIASVEAASAASLKEFPADFKVSITDAPGAASYPICGFTYLLVYQDLSYMKNKDQAQGLVNYIQWCVTDGQKLAGENGYAALPKDAQTKVLEKLKTIVFDGKPLLK
jgi:phosphate transport system substrate-binding protein